MMGWDEATEAALDNLLEIEAKREALAKNTTKPYEEWALEEADTQIEELVAEVIRLRAQLAEAERAGWDQAIAALRDGERARTWLAQQPWQAGVGWREMLARYLTAKKPSRVVFTEHVRKPSRDIGCLHDHEETP